MKTLYGAILILVLSSCGNMKKHENPLIIDFNDRFDFGRLKPGDISKATDYVLSRADNIKNEMNPEACIHCGLSSWHNNRTSNSIILLLIAANSFVY